MTKSNLGWHILLCLLILTSIVLFFFYIQTPSTIIRSLISSSEQSNESLVSAVNPSENKTFQEVYRPEKIVLEDNDAFQIVSDMQSSGQILGIFNENLIQTISNDNEIEQQEFRAAQNNSKEWLIIPFNDEVNFYTLSFIFDSVHEEIDEERITTIYIPLTTDDPKAYFVNDQRQTYYQADLKQAVIDLLSQRVSKITTWQPANRYAFADHIAYLPNKETKAMQAVYMIERRPNSSLIARLFEDTAAVRDLSNSVETRYVDAQGELKINRNNYLLHYQFPINGPKVVNEKVFIDSFETLNSIEQWSERWHYFSIDNSQNTVTYRRYLRDMPVFGSLDYGRSQVQMQESTATNMLSNTLSVRTPITDRFEEKVLPAVQTVLNQLATSKIDINKIQDMTIGYEWQSSKESNRIANFIPQWYIKYQGKWLTYSEIMKGGI